MNAVTRSNPWRGLTVATVHFDRFHARRPPPCSALNDVLRRKRQAYWTERVDADQSHPCRLWRSFDELLGRGRAPPPDINASDLHRYFDDKVAGVRAATSGADSPLFTPCPSEARLSRFVQYDRRRL